MFNTRNLMHEYPVLLKVLSVSITCIARLNSVLLLFVALALGFSLVVGIQHFNQPTSKTQKLSEYKSFLTEDYTCEIQEIISQIQHQRASCISAMDNQMMLAQETADKSESANLSVMKVVEAISSIQTMTQQIAVTTEHQSQVAESLNTSIHEVNESISEASQLSQSTADLGEHLRTETDGLQKSVKAFTF